MGINPNILTPEGWHAALAALEWQLELGVTEITGEDPVDRYALVETQRTVAAVASVAPVVVPTDPVAVAMAAAAQAATLDELEQAIIAFDLCEVKRGAKTTVFAGGNRHARVLILGAAPGREEDQAGRPFVGPAGQLLDRMFAAIGLSRTSPDPAQALYITNVLPWRPPQDRDPTPAEIAMMRPFVAQHIALVNPDVVVCLGNTACQCLLGTGLPRLRGTWTEALGRPALPMAHPEHLLRHPAAKRDAWADLLALQARLQGPRHG